MKTVYLLQHLLTNAARTFHDREAVVWGDDSITYRQLDDVTDRLAATLVENGVSRGDRVLFDGIYPVTGEFTERFRMEYRIPRIWIQDKP